MDDNRSYAHLFGGSTYPPQRIIKQAYAQPLTLVALVDGEASEDYHWNRKLFREASADGFRGAFMFHLASHKRVVARYPTLIARYHESASRISTLALSCVSTQPAI